MEQENTPNLSFLKKTLIAVIVLIGFWILLNGVIGFFNLALSAKALFIFGCVHIFFAFFVYQMFTEAIRKTISRSIFNTLFKHAVFIATVSQISTLFILTVMWSLFHVNTEGFIFFSPALFVAILFFVAQRNIPAAVKPKIMRRLFKLFRTSNAHAHHSDYDYMEPENLDPANPIGLTNPSSPNYIDDHHLDEYTRERYYDEAPHEKFYDPSHF